MTLVSTPAPLPAQGRRSRRICIEAHTEFVETLVAELQSSVARLQTASRRLVDGARGDDQRPAADDAGLSGLEREMQAIGRLVGLLDAIDGSGSGRRLGGVSLPGTILAAGADLDIPLVVSGQWGEELFLAEGSCLRTAMERLRLALSGDGLRGPIGVTITTDREVILEGTMDLTDARRSWQFRSGRRVLEGEGVRVRLAQSGDRYRVALSVGR